MNKYLSEHLSAAGCQRYSDGCPGQTGARFTHLGLLDMLITNFFFWQDEKCLNIIVHYLEVDLCIVLF
jgi:hypothetical protein